MTDYWCERAWLGGDQPAAGVLLTVHGDRIAAAVTDVAVPPRGAECLTGLTLPGFANAHSHAFHRALRGRTQTGEGSFWTWRELMYRAAQRLSPAVYHRLARAAFAEMVQAGMTVVGEFHYVHHRPDGEPYDDANEMGRAVLAAAHEAGLRVTLIDTCYLHGGIDAGRYRDLDPRQRRFSDGNVAAWIDRVDALASEATTATARIAAAAHSVRAVDSDALRSIAQWTEARTMPLHAHVSEQVAENEQCNEAHGCSPVELLAETGLLSERFTAVHATHLGPGDIERLAAAGAGVCCCPTTERDLADGIGPMRALRSAGCSLSLGSDSNAVIDGFEEMRALELDERLAAGRRGNHSVDTLLAAATENGYRALGWPEGGRLAVGALADWVNVRLDSVRLAGLDAASTLASVVFAATAGDVAQVLVGGEVVVRDGVHVSIDAPRELSAAVAELMSE